MSGCANPLPYHPLNKDGTCHYWKCTDALGVVHDEPQCTYWLNEKWRRQCEGMGLSMQAQFAEQARRRSMTPEQVAEEDGRLF